MSRLLEGDFGAKLRGTGMHCGPGQAKRGHTDGMLAAFLFCLCCQRVECFFYILSITV